MSGTCRRCQGSATEEFKLMTKWGIEKYPLCQFCLDTMWCTIQDVLDRQEISGPSTSQQDTDVKCLACEESHSNCQCAMAYGGHGGPG